MAAWDVACCLVGRFDWTRPRFGLVSSYIALGKKDREKERTSKREKIYRLHLLAAVSLPAGGPTSSRRQTTICPPLRCCCCVFRRALPPLAGTLYTLFAYGNRLLIVDLAPQLLPQPIRHCPFFPSHRPISSSLVVLFFFFDIWFLSHRRQRKLFFFGSNIREFFNIIWKFCRNNYFINGQDFCSPRVTPGRKKSYWIVDILDDVLPHASTKLMNWPLIDDPLPLHRVIIIYPSLSSDVENSRILSTKKKRKINAFDMAQRWRVESVRH